MQSTIYENFLTLEEIAQIQEYFDSQPCSHLEEKNGLTCINKNLDYQIPGSFMYKIVRPKIQEIIGDHEVANSSFKENRIPYPLHIDSLYRPDFQKNIIDNNMRRNLAILIPLVEGEHFNTILFDLYDSTQIGIEMMMPKYYEQTFSDTPILNDLDLSRFEHIDERIKKYINKLPVDKIYNWKLGSCITWDRNQLHCSTDFSKYNLSKNCIVLFIA